MNGPDGIVPREPLRAMQIVAGAMIFGLLSFLAIVLVLFSGQQVEPSPVPAMSLVAAAMLFVCVPLSIIIPSIITKAALRQIIDGTWPVPAGGTSEQYATTPAKLLGIRQTTMIIGMALLEGTGFAACTAFLTEHHVPALGIVGLVVLLLLLRFPTQSRVSAWLEQQAQALIDLQRAKDAETG